MSPIATRRVRLGNRKLAAVGAALLSGAAGAAAALGAAAAAAVAGGLGSERASGVRSHAAEPSESRLRKATSQRMGTLIAVLFSRTIQNHDAAVSVNRLAYFAPTI